MFNDNIRFIRLTNKYDYQTFGNVYAINNSSRGVTMHRLKVIENSIPSSIIRSADMIIRLTVLSYFQWCITERVQGLFWLITINLSVFQKMCMFDRKYTGIS